jgi:pimeloyl-ACP methyl ester carboxylesterase
MANFVLVHGGWHGGWCWQRVTPFLRGAGHVVYTPTLTGLGERAHLAHAGIDLAAHVEDVVAVLAWEDLHDVILVGHSYGGMVVAGVAGRVPKRLKHVFYLDAFVPDDGQTLAELLGPETVAAIRGTAVDGWKALPFPIARFGLFEAKDIAWVEPKLVPHPMKTILTPVRIADPAARSVPGSYLYCTQPAMGLFESSAAKARAAGWRYHEIATGHDAMVTAPKEVARLLLDLA